MEIEEIQVELSRCFGCGACLTDEDLIWDEENKYFCCECGEIIK